MCINSRHGVVIGALVTLAGCSSSDEGGGGPAAAVATPMSEISAVGDELIEENAETYDTLGQASDLIGQAFASGAPSSSVASKQAGCIPPELSGQTLLVDVQSDTFTPADPRGPSDAVQFVLLSDPQTEVGYANVTCQGTPPSAISVNVSVNLNDGTEVLNLTASNIFLQPPSGVSAQLAGTLSSRDGDAVPFGMFGFNGQSAYSVDQSSSFASTAFLIDETAVATVDQEFFDDPSFPSETITLAVEDGRDFDATFNCPAAFNYEARMSGTPGNVDGGGIFCARPPVGDDFAYHVNCVGGSIDNLVVRAATLECQENAFFEGEATQVGGGTLQQIQDGTDALVGMHNTVISVARAGGEVALQLAQPAF